MNTYTKLKSGEWGIRVDGEAKSGQKVIVTKKSGEAKTETVGNVLWSGNGVSLCTVSRDSQSQPSYRQDRYESHHVRGVCDECVFNEDAGDGRGCPRHRGNPHT